MRFFFFLSLLCGLSGAGAVEICPPGSGGFSADYEKIRSARATALQELQKRKDVAQVADQTLIDLIQAKSAALAPWLEKAGLKDKSEDAIALAWREEFAKTLAMAEWKYPWVDGIVNDLTKQAFSRKMRVRLESVFAAVKKEAIATVGGFEIPEPERKEIQKRLKTVKLVWMRGADAKKRSPMDVIAWGISYDPTSHSIDVGIDALQYTEDETLFAAIAHEFGHVFDPCRWNAHFRGAQPFTGVLDCLRATDSVGAKKRDDSEMPRLIQSGQLSKQLALGLRLNPTCNRTEYPPTGVQADQLPEAFADWFSAEVTAQSPARLTQSLRADLCRVRELSKGSSYTEQRTRLERIYYAHPKIRQALELPAESAPRYCALAPAHASQ